MGTERDKKIIHRKLDGELSKHETRVFQKKVKTDPAIKVEYESLKKVTETSERIVKPVPPPPDFKKRVIRNIEGDEQSPGA